MNRFQQKCFLASAGLHGLLLMVLLFGSAFLVSKPPPDMSPVVNFINPKMTDGANNGGGNPNARSEPPPPAPQAPKPEPVKPEPVKPEPKPEPVKPEPVKVKVPEVKPLVTEHKPKPIKETPKETIKPTKPLISTTIVRRSNDVILAQQRAAADRAAKEADRKQREETARLTEQRNRIIDAATGIIGDVSRNLSHSMVVGTPGPGGEAFANYGSWVREVYERAWRVSPDLTDDSSSALARVTIRRDGSVAQASLFQKSASAALNKSVQRALEAVEHIGKPFPDGAREAERTFTIEFNLKTRKAIG